VFQEFFSHFLPSLVAVLISSSRLDIICPCKESKENCSLGVGGEGAARRREDKGKASKGIGDKILAA